MKCLICLHPEQEGPTCSDCGEASWEMLAYLAQGLAEPQMELVPSAPPSDSVPPPPMDVPDDATTLPETPRAKRNGKKKEPS